MNSKDLITELAKQIDSKLAKDLVNDFIALRDDCKTGMMGRASVGKFVESVVQLLQFSENGSYDNKPSVDSYLRNLESRPTSFDDDLRIVCARVARAAYTLRNKRKIAHKGTVDPNIYDLRYVFSSVQWMLSEIVRQILKSDMSTAGEMIEFIQIPVSTIVEEIDDRKLVFGSFTVGQEILILLQSYYPKFIPRETIRNSLDRRSNSSISNSLGKLWKEKFIHRRGTEYKLTQEGFKKAVQILQQI